jgi:hypothetical protein
MVDYYDDDDWSLLWWVRVSGRGRVIERGSAREDAVDLLAAKYGQYREVRPTGAVLLIEIIRISGWRATISLLRRRRSDRRACSTPRRSGRAFWRRCEVSP